MKASESYIELRESIARADANVVRSLCTATGFFTPDEVDVAVELVEERLARGDSSGYHFVFAVREGAALGYACYGPIACTRGSFDLYWVVVDPSHQGTGVGRRLVTEVERLAAEQGGRKLYIETSSRELYTATRGFYTRLGYNEAARLADFYDKDDSKIVYVKPLA